MTKPIRQSSTSQPSTAELKTFLLWHLAQREEDRDSRPEAIKIPSFLPPDLREYLQDLKAMKKAVAAANPAIIPRHGDTTEGIVNAAQQEFPGVAWDLVHAALKALKAEGRVHQVDDALGDSICKVWRLKPLAARTPDATPAIERTVREGGPYRTHNKAVVEAVRDLMPDLEGKAGGPHLTEKQQTIWDSLNGCYRTIEWLADELDIDAQQVRNNKSAMKKLGLVIEYKRTRGYYRPDAPPPDLPA